ncbi:MAG TPA: hypothetical protein VK502_00860 [Candidatus Saccharimonadales bacterium]|nr:hypothetical protein [Candidatus Saccharimonadales bacterium]
MAWLQNKQRQVWLEYAGLALFVMIPLLLPGYILTLDLVFTPHFVLPSEVTNTHLLNGTLWALHFILPGDVIEKVILFLILLLSGVGMHLLVHSLRPVAVRTEYWKVATYFAGLLYVINPFTYSRFMAGQWMVLLGYALLPFFIRALFALLRSPSLKSARTVSLFALVISIVSLHHIGMLLCLGLLVIAGASGAYRHNRPHLTRFFGWVGASMLFFCIASLYWVIPVLAGHGEVGASIANFNQSHFDAFKTNGNGAFGAIGEVIRMQGFWAEAQKLFVLPQVIVPMWGLIVLVLWIVIIYGGKKAWHHNRLVVGFSVGSIIIGTILAATPLIASLKEVLPFVAGYREPHKFTNLVVIGYALLGAFGVGYLLQATAKRFNEKTAKIAGFICLALPLLITPTMLWGFSGQLSPRTYPGEWFEVNDYLKKNAKGERVLFLPWHQYANYSFSKRLIANPAEKFFEVLMIISDDPEFRSVPPTQPNSDKQQIATLLKDKRDISPILTRLHIGYVVLAKEQDFKEYGYLATTPGMYVVKENEKVKLYKVGER